MKETKYVYLIIYHEDQDGGFGDAVPCEYATLVFDTEKSAEEYCHLNSNDHVYDVPYAELHSGLLTYKKIELRSLATKEKQTAGRGW